MEEVASNFWFIQFGYATGSVETAKVMKPNTWVKEVVPTQFQDIRHVTYQTMKLDPQALSILQRSARSGTKRREVGRSSVTQQVTTERRHAFLGP